MQQFNFALLPKPSDMSLEGTATITPREGKWKTEKPEMSSYAFTLRIRLLLDESS
jgi:hypothetical protein